ncbi:MAG: hypothetical protein HY744_11025 [Deltaproteobacteria bacterium]|nr:hypothetical protein [Deltaproteobacteria bacterium]
MNAERKPDEIREPPPPGTWDVSPEPEPEPEPSETQERALSLYGWARPRGQIVVVFSGATMLATGALLLLHRAMPGAVLWYGAIGLCLFALFAAPVFAALSATKITAGRDGVLVDRRKPVFVPFTDIAEALEVDDVAIRLILRSGECVDIYTGKREYSHNPRYLRRCNEIFARIRRGVARAKSRRSEHDERRSVETLLGRAHALLRGGERAVRTPYRRLPPPSAEELWNAIESTTAGSTERAAAAVVLRHEPAKKVAERLRAAAGETADPRLQRLLRLCAEQATPEALGEALGEVAAAETSRRDGG